MIEDAIMLELRAQRQAHAAKFNFDLNAIFDDLMERQKNSGRIYVNRSVKKLEGKTYLNGIEVISEHAENSLP